MGIQQPRKYVAAILFSVYDALAESFCYIAMDIDSIVQIVFIYFCSMYFIELKNCRSVKKKFLELCIIVYHLEISSNRNLSRDVEKVFEGLI